MTQSDKYGSGRNDEITKFHLLPGAGVWASIPCLLRDPSKFSISMCLGPGKSIESRNEIQTHIVLPWPRYTEPGAKKVDLECSPDRGSANIKLLKQRRNTQKSTFYCTAWTHIWIPELKKWDLECSAEGGIIGPDSYWALTDHHEACILNTFSTKSFTKQPK